MGHKKDAFYYNSLQSAASYGVEAAQLLSEVMTSYDPEQLLDQIERMHTIEQSADEVRHKVVDELINAFITPIDREDIASLSSSLDDLVDRLEDVLLRLYCDNIQTMRQDALEIMQVVLKAAERVSELVGELPHFKHSKKLRKQVFKINAIEEKADHMYVAAMRNLHTTVSDPLVVFGWHEIYNQLEKCADSCEVIANVVDSIVLKNS